MTRKTVRIVGSSVFVVLIGGLVGLWWTVGGQEGSASQAGGPVSNEAASLVARPPMSVEELEAVEVFQEIVAWREEAAREAEKVVARRRGSLVGPSDNREEKRAMIESRFMERALEHMAATRELPVGELEVIFDRGRQEGWPPR